MPKQQTFTFLPVTALKKVESKIFVSYNPRNHFVTFNRRDQTEVEGFVGKHIQLFVDTQKKTLAWVFAPRDFVNPQDLKNYQAIKALKDKKDQITAIRFYVPQPVVLALKMDKSLKKVEVKKYKPAEYLDHNTYNYIEL